MIEQINYLLGCFLHNTNQIGLLEPSIANNFADAMSQSLIFLTRLSKISDICPQLPSILEIDQKLGDVGMRALQRITQYFSWTVRLQLDVYWSVAALSEGNGLGIYIYYQVPEKKM